MLLLTSVLLLGTTAAARRPVHAGGQWTASALYSQRALRRARTILQLKLLEMRKAKLERVRRALEQRLPVSQLLDIH